jgi:hypothetical protein
VAVESKSWTADEILTIYSECSNWGRWGPDDELGTLNFITPAKVAQAAGLVSDGRLVSIGKDISTEKSGQNPRPAVHTVHYEGPGAHSVTCALSTHNHGPQTHMDPTSHVIHNGMVYPGKKAGEVVTDQGLAFGSIYARRGGIMTRAVLLDIPRARGVDYLDPSDVITAADLTEAERLAGVEVTSGDAILVRAGIEEYLSASGQQELSPRTGLGPDCIRWIHDKEVALVCNECPERLPSICPEIGIVWHVGGLVYLGLTFVESVRLAELTEIAHERRRYDFMLVVAPQRFPYGTGNLVNPLVAL